MRAIGLIAAVLAVPSALLAQAISSSEITPRVLLFATPAGNVVATFAPDGAFLVGPLSVASTPAIQQELARRTSSPARYVVGGPRRGADAEGDGGWGRQGAFVVVQENSWGRQGDDAHLAAGGADRPRAAFSEFLKFALSGHEYHIVHQKPGFSDADVLVHFEDEGVVYLGESLPGDGYPAIDSVQGGTLNGLLQTITPWTRGGNKFIPARGPALTGDDVSAFRDMLVAVRDRVRAMRSAGQSADQVVAAHPTREFDERWGRGRVSAEAFVRSVYREAAR